VGVDIILSKTTVGDSRSEEDIHGPREEDGRESKESMKREAAESSFSLTVMMKGHAVA
jgi:hypothetical protein